MSVWPRFSASQNAAHPHLPSGMGFGIVMGILFGVMFKNVGLGLVFGILFGAVVSGAARRKASSAEKS